MTTSPEPYELYSQGLRLMRGGSPAAAAEVLARLVDADPDSRSAREALGRALFRSGRYDDALETFRWIAERDPSDDYAQFGAGIAASRAGDLIIAAGHLALAVALSPERDAYRRELDRARGLLASEGPRPGSG